MVVGLTFNNSTRAINLLGEGETYHLVCDGLCQLPSIR